MSDIIQLKNKQYTVNGYSLQLCYANLYIASLSLSLTLSLFSAHFSLLQSINYPFHYVYDLQQMS